MKRLIISLQAVGIVLLTFTIAWTASKRKTPATGTLPGFISSSPASPATFRASSSERIGSATAGSGNERKISQDPALAHSPSPTSSFRRSSDRDGSSGAEPRSLVEARKTTTQLQTESHEEPLEISATEAAEDHAVHVPLFFRWSSQEIEEKIPGVSAEGMNNLKDAFAAEAGIGEYPPDDPKYRERWDHAVITLEQRMRVWYGWGAWAAFEHENALQATASSHP